MEKTALSIKKHMENHKIEPKKHLGQHFLLDENFLDKIVKNAQINEGDLVLEIGPGPGGLTRALLKAGAFVLCIEKDKQFIPLLKELKQLYPNQLDILEKDALKIESFSQLTSPIWQKRKDEEKDIQLKLVSNLPYGISTPLIMNMLKDRDFYQYTIMIQKEVAERLASKEGKKSYGRLSIVGQFACTIKIGLHVPAEAFYPKPKVQSSIVHMIPKKNENFSDLTIEDLEWLCGIFFQQRRKKIKSSYQFLKNYLTEEEFMDILETEKVSADSRAEDLSVETLVAICEKITPYRKKLK